MNTRKKLKIFPCFRPHKPSRHSETSASHVGASAVPILVLLRFISQSDLLFNQPLSKLGVKVFLAILTGHFLAVTNGLQQFFHGNAIGSKIKNRQKLYRHRIRGAKAVLLTPSRGKNRDSLHFPRVHAFGEFKGYL